MTVTQLIEEISTTFRSCGTKYESYANDIASDRKRSKLLSYTWFVQMIQCQNDASIFTECGEVCTFLSSDTIRCWSYLLFKIRVTHHPDRSCTIEQMGVFRCDQRGTERESTQLFLRDSSLCLGCDAAARFLLNSSTLLFSTAIAFFLCCS